MSESEGFVWGFACGERAGGLSHLGAERGTLLERGARALLQHVQPVRVGVEDVDHLHMFSVERQCPPSASLSGARSHRVGCVLSASLYERHGPLVVQGWLLKGGACV